ncbi:hypothetical protein OA07_25485 [Aphanizomenon flos-aquae 2012/KM1/D3]|nr:hypothetical protein OA07_25485 [Aphanizomenon flos-aquae 2012/KM1/D3]
MPLESITAEQRTVLYNVSWDTFEALLKDTGEDRRTFSGQTTANCHQTRNKNPTPNPLPASDEGAKMYLIRLEIAVRELNIDPDIL